MIFMVKPKLYMILLGCTPPGRHTEQHDLFFTINHSLQQAIPAINNFWPEVAGKIHIDAWREVTEVNGFKVEVVAKNDAPADQSLKLFFINLGGYKAGEFDEPHYKLLVVAENLSDAIKQAKHTAWYKHNRFPGAPSHVDDRFGVDVDDFFQVVDVLPEDIREKYSLFITPTTQPIPDKFHLGYLKLFKS